MTARVPMHDDYAADPSYGQAPPQPRGRSLMWAVIGLLAALLLGGAVSLWAALEAGWIDWRGFGSAPAARAVPRVAAAPVPTVRLGPIDEQAQAALGVRIAELEQRIAQVDMRTVAAADNMSRAEGLMVAFAVRRAIERGLSLGFLENQLKLRFGDAQPNAVATLIAAGGSKVTLDRLLEGLNTLSPQLVDAPPAEGAWAKVQRELSGLFVLRKTSAPSRAPQRRLERAHDLLEAGRVDAAIAEVQRLPGRAAATGWLELARRYVTTQRALDLIETAAMLEPHRLGTSEEAVPAAPDPTAPTPGATQDTTAPVASE